MGSFHIYEELARGGVGLVISGFTSVADNDHYINGMMRLSHDRLIPQYRKLADIVHKYKSAIIAQLALGAYYKDGLRIEPDFPNNLQNATSQESACISCNGCYASKGHKCILRK